MSSDASRLRVDTPSALPVGTRLGEFELLSLLGVGGFGIVYLAFDHALEREVAVKEYMPASLAGRTETMRVSLRSQSDAESFALGLRSFVNEAKLLARFDHPSLLKVHRFWEANGTAYMAMPVLRGRTVKEIRQEMAGPPDEAWLRSILMPLMGAIETLHNEGVFHRDIAPDNIQIEPGGRPVLLDFGAARRVLSDKSQALTAILKPAYAPIEQYGEAGAVRQGPWTDLYALGATLHYLLLGRPPPPATARTIHDEASALTADQLPGCSGSFLYAIDWMLCPRPADRPQSVAELRDVLEGRKRAPVRRPPESPPQHWERTSALPPDAVGDHVELDIDQAKTQFVPRQGAMPTAMPAALAPVGTTEHVWIEPASKLTEVDIPAADMPEMTAQRPAAAVSKRRSAWLPLVVVAVLALAAGAAFMLWPQAVPVPVAAPLPAPAVVAAPAPVVVPAAMPAAAEAASQPAMAMPAPAVAEAPAPPIKTVEVPDKPAPVKPAVQRPAQVIKPAPEPSKPRPEPAVPPPAPEPVAAPSGPAPACGPREGIRYHVCMERECGRGEFAGSGACQRWKQDAKRE